mmetsp:Transcript_91192/g.162402  ORF Transcript_91192/g.162402 Transcript_91192/m.162402 type:complete len:352 (-) Transcript_91192:51-1106(-)|eukprot:CAMPEP_0197659126 /NCGR_PEP_ID=MMETSP1338-20131121/46307_1 /TAXON_ID=43686 ORGANISM="Pelagodinium beii, Strain RCC1491" /NCGR_SAMPLE_ID=MMETSP1338 /ASSEMBLY_ACC=CAM_ASM_000754 /LENGTH=351 /DNA_ID=CAMNT_0043235901 /DNA_START=61 /DNA_END=1116 /DNA_ORIENTATION=-
MSGDKSYGSCDGALPEEDPDQTGSEKSFTSWWRSEWDLAKDASVEVMADFFDSITGLETEDPYADPRLRYNPIWWLAVGACVLCFLPGHSFHSLIGQGDKVRPDETDAERRARVGWVYTYSGGFVVTIIMDMVPLMRFEAAKEPDYLVRSEWVAIAISLWYLIGDANLLYQMSRRDTILMHASVSSRMSFGTALLFVFIALWVYQGHDYHGITLETWTAVAWFLRLAFCLFMVVASYGYAPLLGLCYDKAAAEDPSASPWTKPNSKRLRLVTVLGPLLLLGLSLLCIGTGPHPQYLLMIPCFVLAVALAMDGWNLTGKTLLATAFSLSPMVVVSSGFAIGGPGLWDALAGM